MSWFAHHAGIIADFYFLAVFSYLTKNTYPKTPIQAGMQLYLIPELFLGADVIDVQLSL